MNYTYPIEEYMKQLQLYNELEAMTFSPEDSREYIIGKLEERSTKKRVIADVANTVIREYIEFFEKDPGAITASDAETLTRFLEMLRPAGLYTGQATDFGVLYRLAKLMADYYRKKNDLNRYAFALNLCSYGYRAFIQSHSHTPWESPYTEACIELVQRIDQLDNAAQSYALAALSRTVVMEPDVFPLERFQTINKMMMENLPRPLSDQDGLILLIMHCNILDAFKETCLFAADHGVTMDRETLRPFLKEISGLVQENIDQDRTYGLGRIKLENLLLITDYLLGEFTTKELLNALREEMEETQQSPSLSVRGYGLGGIGHDYLNLLFKCSPLPREEIVRISQDLIRDVLPRLLPLSRQVNNPQFNRYIVTFLNAASLTGSFDDFAEIILESTVYADRPLFIHTAMVREMSLSIFDYMIEATPEVFDGVAGKSEAYIRSHKDEMKRLLSDCCMYHDVGKFFALDIVENSMRRLTDDEYQLIREHPGCFEHIYQIIDDRDERVRCIRDCALTHHRWHDGTRGYPDVPHTKNLPFVDILAIADSIDAATDFLGRPYNSGKTIDQLIAEFQDRAGTQYGPEAAAALSAPEVRDRLQYWITDGRKDIYYQIYAFNTIRLD